MRCINKHVPRNVRRYVIRVCALLVHVHVYIAGIFQRKLHGIITGVDFCNMILREILFLKQ